MTLHRSYRAVALALGLAALLCSGGVAGIVRRAASIPEAAEGLEGFVNAANALIVAGAGGDGRGRAAGLRRSAPAR